MKTLWTTLSVIAIANILALAGLVGWLKATDRLDLERVNKVREVFLTTTVQDKIAEEQAAVQKEADAKAAEEAVKAARPPATAIEQMVAKDLLSEKDRQDVNRLAKEVEILRTSLVRERAELDRIRAQLETDRAGFLAMRKKIKEQEGTAQFQKALGVLSAMKPDQAKMTLAELLRLPVPAVPTEAGEPSTGPLVANGQRVNPGVAPAPATPAMNQDGMDLVVGYLNAMDDRARSRIMGQFVQTDPALAGQLLERLRTRGIDTASSQAAQP
jgi:hypothetical protein